MSRTFTLSLLSMIKNELVKQKKKKNLYDTLYIKLLTSVVIHSMHDIYIKVDSICSKSKKKMSIYKY